MKKFLVCIIIVLMCSSCAFTESESFDIAGRWLIKGVGHVDKSFVRSSLELSGYMNIQTSGISGDIQLLESYDGYLRIDATTLDIKVYDKHMENGIRTSVPVPTRIPTADYPIELPAITTDDGITYKITITGSNSGTVTITGVIRDVSVIGDVDLDSDCKFWRNGTPEPKIDESKNSGCNSSLNILTLILILIFVTGVQKRVRN